MGDSKKNRFDLDEHEPEEFETEVSASHEDEDYESDESDFTVEDDHFDDDKDRVVGFLKYPKNKRKLKEFIEDTYRSIELEDVERTINRKNYEHESELEGSTEYHKPGHIGALMYQYLNMVGVENAFVSGLQHTKSSMTKTIQQKVDEINTLLRGVGGFNRQLKASFSRSAVIYLEQEDPRNTHRERVVFTVNLADFELRYPLDDSASDQITDDGRSIRRLVWDEAVNTLSEIISNTGLKPKYVKNDKNSCSLTMRQYLLSEKTGMPDEYFAFDLRHVNDDQRESLSGEYVNRIQSFDAEIEKTQKKINSRWIGKKSRASHIEKLHILNADRDFYIGTTADPKEMDTGLVFSIYVNTMKDYTLTKDKMQVIMTKFILALSSIAVDKSMDQQVNTQFQLSKSGGGVQDISERLSNTQKKTVKRKKVS